MKNKFSVILPCFNEYDNLKFLIPKIIKVLKKKIFEIIIVDDNSLDKTIPRLRNKFKNFKFIKYLLRKKNRSLAESIKDGIYISRYNNIIVMDADFNHEPLDLKKMLLHYEKKKLDMLCGSRFLKGGGSTNYFRHFASLFFNIFVNILTKGNLSDNLSGFYIIKKKFLNKKILKNFYGYGEYYIRLLFFMQKKKINIDELPVKYGLRKYGKSKSKLIKMFFLYSLETIKLLK